MPVSQAAAFSAAVQCQPQRMCFMTHIRQVHPSVKHNCSSAVTMGAPSSPRSSLRSPGGPARGTRDPRGSCHAVTGFALLLISSYKASVISNHGCIHNRTRDNNTVGVSAPYHTCLQSEMVRFFFFQILAHSCIHKISRGEAKQDLLRFQTPVHTAQRQHYMLFSVTLHLTGEPSWEVSEQPFPPLMSCQSSQSFGFFSILDCGRLKKNLCKNYLQVMCLMQI